MRVSLTAFYVLCSAAIVTALPQGFSTCPGDDNFATGAFLKNSPHGEAKPSTDYSIKYADGKVTVSGAAINGMLLVIPGMNLEPSTSKFKKMTCKGSDGISQADQEKKEAADLTFKATVTDINVKTFKATAFIKGAEMTVVSVTADLEEGGPSTGREVPPATSPPAGTSSPTILPTTTPDAVPSTSGALGATDSPLVDDGYGAKKRCTRTVTVTVDPTTPCTSDQMSVPTTSVAAGTESDPGSYDAPASVDTTPSASAGTGEETDSYGNSSPAVSVPSAAAGAVPTSSDAPPANPKTDADYAPVMSSKCPAPTPQTVTVTVTPSDVPMPTSEAASGTDTYH